ncbi:hypothetical protein [Plastoroseomonas hellenica]|uniref:hypothetical protein n=1 Tax=Plastoroseomonas hellenica TaxID=2687306 RepID=UPI001BAD5812|nr:hypothetical protein [Plastoroseomonas hellenica]MBR0643973.1 hypothetical protein [Plastoroseomonas hellenica]
MMVAASILWAAIWWRMRGGAWETWLRLPASTIAARVASAVAIALPSAPELGWTAGLVAIALWLGMTLAGWGDAMDIGRVEGTRWGDAVVMSGWGLVTLSPAIVLALLQGWSWWPLLTAALAFGPIYAAAWWAPRPPVLQGFAAGATEWAEVAVGATIGLALNLT